MKFVSVKGKYFLLLFSLTSSLGIILVSYWQNLLIAILSQAGAIDSPGSLQGILIAIECVPAAFLVLRAFPISPYTKEAVDASPLDSMTGKDVKQLFGK